MLPDETSVAGHLGSSLSIECFENPYNMPRIKKFLCVIFTLFCWAQISVADECDLVGSLKVISTELGVTDTIENIGVSIRRSTEPGEWRILFEGDKVVAIERQDNFENGSVVVRFMKTRDGSLVASLLTDSDGEQRFIYLYCKNQTYFSVPGPNGEEASEAYELARQLRDDFIVSPEIREYSKNMVLH